MADGYKIVFRRSGPVAGPRARPEALVFAKAERGMTEIAGFLQKQVVQRTPKGVGGGAGLRGSIKNDVRGTTLGTLRGEVFTASKYALPVEEGRRAGATPPPVKGEKGLALRLWVRRKFRLRSEKKILSAAFATARAIGKRGIVGKFMFRDALKDNQERIAARLRKLGFDIAENLNGE